MITDADRLRELLHEATPQPPRPVDLEEVAARVAVPARAPLPLRRLSPLAAVAVIAAIVVLVVALQHGAHTAKPAPTHPASPHPAPTLTTAPGPTSRPPSRPAQPPASEGVVYSTYVLDAGFAVIVAGPGPDGVGRIRLLATTNWGRTFTDIGPAISSDWRPDSFFALDRTHMWLSVYSGGTIAVEVYRTSDGGQHWSRASAGAHNAGGFSTVDFVNTADGFVYDANQGQNASALLGTHDGGADWQPVSDTRSGNVPPWGVMRFVSNSVGWIGASDSGQLFRTEDGGRSWVAEPVAGLGPGYIGAPVLRSGVLLLPIQTPIGAASPADRSTISIYRRKATGGVFMPVATLSTSGALPGDERSPSVVFPTATSAWATVLDNGLVAAYRWDGNSWSRATAPYGRTIFQPHTEATDAEHAWLSFVSADNTGLDNNTEVFRTSDGGRTWQRIDLTALATHG